MKLRVVKVREGEWIVEEKIPLLPIWINFGYFNDCSMIWLDEGNAIRFCKQVLERTDGKRKTVWEG